MIMDLHAWARIPNGAPPGKFGENDVNAFKHLQEAELACYHHTGWENEYSLSNFCCTERKTFQNNLPTSSLYFWWLFFPLYPSQRQHFIEHYQFHYLASY